MCTVFLAWHHHANYPLILASNRDEFHQRPTAAAKWNDDGLWFGGRDEREGGGWLGASKSGRFAVLTNYRAPANDNPDAQSRGALVRRWLTGESSVDFQQHLEADAAIYNGFNLLFGDVKNLHYFGNRSQTRKVQPLAAGIYGLSNALLDVPWPKVLLGKRRFETLVAYDDVELDVLSGLMTDRRPAPDGALPSTGMPIELERLLSSLFIVSPAYGTRATTVVTFDAKQQAAFKETRYAPSGAVSGEDLQRFAIESQDD